MLILVLRWVAVNAAISLTVLSVDVNQPVNLRVQAADGRADLFPRFRVYDDSGTVVATLDAAHLQDGLYGVDWTPTDEGLFTAQCRFYSDSGHTTDAEYDYGAEEIRVDSTRDTLARILGLVQQNVVIDQQVYDSDGNLTSARTRTYDTAAHALAGGATGMIARYAVSASYTAGRLVSYSVTEA